MADFNAFVPDPEDVQKNRAMGILAYISLLVLAPIFGAKESAFARFHANQGLVLFIVEVICSILSGIFGGILGFIVWAVQVVCFVFSIMGIVSASKGQCRILPIIGGIQILK